MSKLILLGAGAMKRWNNHLGGPKFMAPVGGRPLLSDTIDRFRKLGTDDITFVTREKVPAASDTRQVVFSDNPDAAPSSKFLSSREEWNADGWTTLAFADVWWSSTALQLVDLELPGLIIFIGRKGPSRFTECAYGEIFALRFGAESHGIIENALAEVDALHSKKTPQPSGWGLYRTLKSHLKDDGAAQAVFLDVDDYTDDFDFPRDYKRWTKNYESGNFWVTKDRKEVTTSVPPLLVVALLILGAAIGAFLF
ncbi:MAG: NTP transferase domain-containing protein [Pseudomonadota bacterium]